MPPRQWKLYLEDILSAIDKVQRYTHSMDLDRFRASDITIDAVIRNFTIIGEAARQIPSEIEQRYSDVPWHKMRSLRNIVVHEYFGVDMRIVWETIHKDLPPIVPLLKNVMDNES